MAEQKQNRNNNNKISYSITPNPTPKVTPINTPNLFNNNSFPNTFQNKFNDNNNNNQNNNILQSRMNITNYNNNNNNNNNINSNINTINANNLSFLTQQYNLGGINVPNIRIPNIGGNNNPYKIKNMSPISPSINQTQYSNTLLHTNKNNYYYKTYNNINNINNNNVNNTQIRPKLNQGSYTNPLPSTMKHFPITLDTISTSLNPFIPKSDINNNTNNNTNNNSNRDSHQPTTIVIENNGKYNILNSHEINELKRVLKTLQTHVIGLTNNIAALQLSLLDKSMVNKIEKLIKTENQKLALCKKNITSIEHAITANNTAKINNINQNAMNNINTNLSNINISNIINYNNNNK